MRESKRQPLYFSKLLLYLLLCLAMIFMINSRLQVLVFLLTVILFVFNTGMKSRLMFFASIFFVPILLNFALLVYRILSLPALEAILMRVSKQDVTTFNGRAYLWQTVLDWLMNNQTGLWFGNGYKGHVVLHLLDFEAKVRWHVNTYQMHLHSTAFELLTSTGIIGYGLFIVIMYKTFLYLRKAHGERRPEAVFIPVMFFIVWVLQIDTLVYIGSVGNVFLALLWAMVTVGYKRKAEELETPAALKVLPGTENGARVESVNQY
jgi:hypothetical protein